MINKIFLQITKVFFFYLFLSTLVLANVLTVNLKKLSSLNNSIAFTITNNSHKVINILKTHIPHENIILKDVFDVYTNINKIQYTGKLIKYSTSQKEYLSLRPNESYSTNIDLSDYYDIPSNEVITILYKKNMLNYSIEQLPLKISTSFQSKKLAKASQKTMQNYNQCSTSQIAIIEKAQSLAHNISHNAYYALLNEENNTWAERYITWFGSANYNRQKIVTESLEKIYQATQNINFDCSCNDSYYAYVYPTKKIYTIYLCDGFWKASLSGIDSQSGTIIHQLSHFKKIANTQTHSLGFHEAKMLAIEFAYYTVYNADSYEYFTENTPFLPMSNIFHNAMDISHEDFPLLGKIDTENNKNVYQFKVDISDNYNFFAFNHSSTYIQGRLYEGNTLVKYNSSISGFSFTHYLSAGKTYLIVIDSPTNQTSEYTLNYTFTPPLNNSYAWLSSSLLLLNN